MLGLRFCARAFSSCGKRGPLFIAVRGPLTIAASLVGTTGSRRAGSVVVAHGPSCSAACGIFPDQGSNPCPLHWQSDSQPLRHQGSPIVVIFIRLLFTRPMIFVCFVFVYLYILSRVLSQLPVQFSSRDIKISKLLQEMSDGHIIIITVQSLLP